MSHSDYLRSDILQDFTKFGALLDQLSEEELESVKALKGVLTEEFGNNRYVLADLIEFANGMVAARPGEQ